MTPLLKVLTQYCDTYVDDIRMKEKATLNPPLYAREMSQYFIPAISLFNLPAEMPEYLLGNKTSKKFVEPIYDNKRYTVAGDKTEPFIIDLGYDYSRHELFSAHILSVKGNSVFSIPTDICEYDDLEGKITVNASEENPVKDNTTFDFDFYTDGWFKEDLSPEIMNILGMCFQVVWQDRFNTDWLSNVSKVEDKSFYEQNRANKMNADGDRLHQLRLKLAEEMSSFERNQWYRNIVGASSRLKIF